MPSDETTTTPPPRPAPRAPNPSSASPILLLATLLDNYVRGTPEPEHEPNPIRQCFQTTESIHGTVVRVFHHVTYPIAFVCAFLYHIIRYAKEKNTDSFYSSDTYDTAFQPSTPAFASDQDSAPHLVSRRTKSSRTVSHQRHGVCTDER